jgi:hypothetical protein
MKYTFEGYDILAPLSIVSNQPVFESNTVSLKIQRTTQAAQRWELSFGILTDSPADMMASIATMDTPKTMLMPQLNDVNERLTGTSASTTTYVVTASGGKFYIGGSQNPALIFVRGNTYIFDLSDSSLSSHPLRFATAADAAGSTQYTTGVTVSGTQGTAGATVTIVVSGSAPNTLYYYCTNHSGMGNSIAVANGAAGVNYPKGAFVTGSNNKVYMVKADASTIVGSNLYPTPPNNLTYSSVATATITYLREVDNMRGITFSDGVLSNPGTITIIEAL